LGGHCCRPQAAVRCAAQGWDRIPGAPASGGRGGAASKLLVARPPEEGESGHGPRHLRRHRCGAGSGRRRQRRMSGRQHQPVCAQGRHQLLRCASKRQKLPTLARRSSSLHRNGSFPADMDPRHLARLQRHQHLQGDRGPVRCRSARPHCNGLPGTRTSRSRRHRTHDRRKRIRHPPWAAVVASHVGSGVPLFSGQPWTS